MVPVSVAFSYHGVRVVERFAPPAEPRSFDEVLTRIMDVSIAVAAIVFLLPILLLVAFILANEGGPIIFAHKRVGRGGRPFYCYKFRSMVVDAEERLARLLRDDPQAQQEWLRDHKLRNDPRVTSFGRFLRRSSIDELPQLFNVIRGDMSIVGPRPIVDAEVPRYGRRIASYYRVKPGITGIWQVSGRNDVEYRTRVAMDCVYARAARPSLYIWLVIATVPAVLSRKGSY
ncbi:MAG: sugar transferase [Alphaproteobacteria bacterium]|nr:sugar transferase [Alphaproteobacteria bacterium]MBV9692145.1 sugar transferase [Alphaproteobacteria bacterium]